MRSVKSKEGRHIIYSLAVGLLLPPSIRAYIDRECRAAELRSRCRLLGVADAELTEVTGGLETYADWRASGATHRLSLLLAREGLPVTPALSRFLLEHHR